jgi:4a-hydroxytetrahydrobiopterin dehydratase
MTAELSSYDITRHLAAVPEWKLAGKTVERKLKFKDFREAMSFVNRVADLAEAADHHPDIIIHYNQVTLVLWTHTAGGLTDRDFRLAAEIDRVV